MSKTLGLDLGTNSIGWAIVDSERNKILGMGSRIFPEGVENLGEGEGRETSKNASRTDARGTRRQFFRRRLRKRYLLRELAKHNFCPIDYSSIKIWNEQDFFKNPLINDWFQLNPYELRAKAIKEKISMEEIGRIFYHLIQRRGFQSNNRSAGAENNEKSVIFKGDPKIGKIGISETLESIEENNTLGSYLNEIYPKDNQPYSGDQERIRNRYTTRQMYIDEFEKIWEFQKQFHSELSKELKTIFGGRKKDGYEEDGVLFHQRPLRSQKHLVGNCSFEPKKTKCQISSIPFELFRVHQWANTVLCDLNGVNQPITEKDREMIVKLLLSKEKVKFSQLRKAIQKTDRSYQFNYKDDDSIVGTTTISNLSNKKFFGEKWIDFTEKEQEDIWHVLYFFDDRTKLKEYAIHKWGFDEEKAIKISKFNLKDGYSNLSRKAINNILPFLKLGYMYDVAVALGGVKNAMGSNWEVNEEFLIDNVPSIVKSNMKGGYIDQLKNTLINEFGTTEKQLSKLYHHSSNINTEELLDKLPVNKNADKEIQSIKNPVVITALFEIRKLVNELINEHGKFDEIKIELARDLKISKTKRNDIRREQKRLERENDRVKAELDYIGQKNSHINILKYKLWEECNNTCPYTGKTISVKQLFTGEIQIEHIFPWSRSLNDSYMNKTLCFADENRAKGNLTPYEYYSKQGEQKWEDRKQQALNCFKNKQNYPNAYAKFKQFVKQKHDSDFISRQLNDTRYISKEAKNYLAKICDKVFVAPGQMTANLRHHWGLNSILNKEEDTKTREDHRHHAIDALVMACTTTKHLQELTKWNRYDRSYELNEFPTPWTNFRQDAEKQADKILVSHKKTNNLLTIRTHKVKKNGVNYTNKGVSARGQLHKETVFGKRTAPQSKEAYHVRKPLESLTTKKHIDKIVDSKIRELILKRIEMLGGFEKDKIPKETFFTSDESGNIKPEIYLPNKNGQPVPIKKVRIKENIGGAEQLKTNINQHVNPRSNHHVLIYKNTDDKLQEEVITFWTAVERKRQQTPVFQLPLNGKEIVATLQINDMFILGLDEDEINWNKPDYSVLKQHVYRVQKLSSKFYEFRLNSESKIDKNTHPYYIRIQGFGKGKTGWNTFNPIKVKITPSGRIKKV